MSYELAIYTLYDHPVDYPDEFVIRRFTFDKTRDDAIPDKELFFRSTSLANCRKRMREIGLYPLNRNVTDDPVIIESYI